MSISREDVRKVAGLARLSLTPDQEVRMERQLSQVLDYVAGLQALDVTGVEPLSHGVELEWTPERADEVRPSLTQDQALANAPSRVGEGIAVPRIIE